MEDKKSVFETLNAINVSEHIEKKGQLSYLSWAWAWSKLQENYPNSSYKVYKNDKDWNYHTDQRSGWVEVGVTVEGVEHIEMLPIMDFRNKSLPLDKITSMEVNKAIKRACTKAIALHGLGLYIYAGEDLPEAPKTEVITEKTQATNNPDLLDQNQIRIMQASLDILNDKQTLRAMLDAYSISSISQMRKEHYEASMKAINKRIEAKN